MNVHFNTDGTTEGSERLAAYFREVLNKDLARFDNHITRIEVHVSDQVGDKVGVHNKKCVLEARVEGRQPVVVSNSAETNEQAIIGAIPKLKSALDSVLGKMKSH